MSSAAIAGPARRQTGQASLLLLGLIGALLVGAVVLFALPTRSARGSPGEAVRSRLWDRSNGPEHAAGLRRDFRALRSDPIDSLM